MATYTQRYIAAATRALASPQRDDLARELEASIDDAVSARVGAGESADAAERAVLTEMGDPALLSADYGERPLMLIGPRSFLDWSRLLRLLLWIVLPAVAVTMTLVQLLAGAGVGDTIGSVVVVTATVGVHICFWVTLAFAILERTRSAPTSPLLPWSLDRLPELRRGTGLSDLVASLVFLTLAAGALIWDRFVGFVPAEGELVPLLDPDLWPAWIVGALVLLVAEGVLAVAIHRTGRWTVVAAVANTVLAAAFAVPVVWLVLNGMLVNPAFVDLLVDAVPALPDLATVVAVAVALAAVWDAVDGGYKTWRDRRQ